MDRQLDDGDDRSGRVADLRRFAASLAEGERVERSSPLNGSDDLRWETLVAAYGPLRLSSGPPD